MNITSRQKKDCIAQGKDKVKSEKKSDSLWVGGFFKDCLPVFTEIIRI